MTKAFEDSLTYASYERTQETAYLLSGQTFLSKSSTSTGSRFRSGSETMNVVPDIMPRSRCVLVMCACLFFLMTSFGMVVALGVIYVELISYFECPRSEAALVQSVFMGLSLAGGIFVGKIITRYDIGACIMIAAGIGSVATVCGSFARDIYTVIGLVGIVAGLATSVPLLGASVIVNWTFVNNRKLALGVLSCGPAVGQIVIPYITDALIVHYRWQGALMILSALTLLNCIPCGLFIYYSKRYFHKGNDNNTKSHFSLISVASDAAFMIFMVTAFIFPGIGPVEQWFSVDLAVMKGFGLQAGAILLSLNGIMGLVSRLISTLILIFYPHTKPGLHMCYSFLLWAIAHFGFVESKEYWEMVLAMILRGYAAGVVTAFLPSLQLELRGSALFPQTLSISYFLYGAGQILGGFLGGYSVDVTGSYNLIFYIATACFVYCGISMLIIYLILKRRNGQGYSPIS